MADNYGWSADDYGWLANEHIATVSAVSAILFNSLVNLADSSLGIDRVVNVPSMI